MWMRDKKRERSLRTAAAVQFAKMSAVGAARVKLVGVGVPGVSLSLRIRNTDGIIIGRKME